VRLVAAIGVIAVGLAAAVYVHERRTANPKYTAAVAYCNKQPNGCTSIDVPQRVRPSWDDPAAVLLSIGGIAVAAGILTARRYHFANPS
jgi:hypothetical protein